MAVRLSLKLICQIMDVIEMEIETDNHVITSIRKGTQSLSAVGFAFSDVVLRVGDVLTLETLNRYKEARKEYLNLQEKHGCVKYYIK